jgi:ribosomal-protein-alanine N-acetyltransferase
MDLASPFEPFPDLETPRLRLRAVTMDDAEDMFRVQADPRVWKYFGKAPPADVDAIRRKIAELDESVRAATGIRWAIVERETGAYLGGVGFWHWDKPHFRAEIGYEIAPSHWGRGLLPEALGPVLRFGFDRMALHSVEGRIHPDNRASARVLEKAGFVREGYFRESYFNDQQGVFEDTAVYSLVRPG